MKISEYFESGMRPEFMDALKRCEWDAAKFLVKLIEENSFGKTLGSDGKLFFLSDGKDVVSFLTLTTQDCIVAPDKFPWIGFVYTFPQYRGHRYAGILLDHARKAAAGRGFPFVFLATDYTGVYEKYGFRYLENRKCIHETNSRIYTAEAADIFESADKFSKRAEKIIVRSGVRAAWESAGATVNLVGSLATGLIMKHRDIDFHVYTDKLDHAESFKVMAALASNPLVTRLDYKNLADTEEACFEWHLWFRDEVGEEWQIDIIQIQKGSQFDGYFENIASRIRAVLTPETRRAVLELKYLTPDDVHIIGIEYYEAVIGGGVRTWREFLEWRKAHPVTGICTWCP